MMVREGLTGIQHDTVSGQSLAASQEVWGLCHLPSAVTLGKSVYQHEVRFCVRKAGQIIPSIPRDPRKMFGENGM